MDDDMDMDTSSDSASRLQTILATKMPLQFKSLTRITEPKDERYETIIELDTPNPINPPHSSSFIRTLLQRDRTSQRSRLVVQGGPDSMGEIHATQTFSGLQASSICWAKVSGHSVVSVLVNPTTLTVYDIFPGSDLLIGPEGWTVTLPFECCGIFGMEQLNGILLQRMEHSEDRQVVDYLEDDGFILKAPPKLNRVDNPSSSLPGQNPADFPQPESSLFSLAHPLEAVLPVSQVFESGNPAAPVTDAFEKILWIGTSRNTTNGDEVTLMVTHHSIHNRHSFFAVEPAPTQNEATPLYVLSRNWRQTGNAYSTLDFVLPHDDDDVPKPFVSRDDALADALGVRKTPHASVSRPRARDSEAHAAASSAAAHMSFFSTSGNDVVEPAADSRGDASQFRGLEPKWAVRLLFKEGNQSSSSPADSIFLASSSTGDGLTTLCLFSKVTSTLRLYSVSKDVVSPQPSISCRGAFPVEALKGNVDVLVDLSDSLLLYRSELPVCLCTAPADSIGASLSTPTKDRLTIGASMRGSLTLETQNPLVNAVLDAWDAVVPAEISLAIRADVARLCREPSIDPWCALEAVWNIILGCDPTPPKSTNTANTMDDWKRLLESDFHHSFSKRRPGAPVVLASKGCVFSTYETVKSDRFKSLAYQVTKDLPESFPFLFDALFILNEDHKIASSRCTDDTVKIARLLRQACFVHSRNPISTVFSNYLAGDVGECPGPARGESAGKFTSFSSPPSILSWVDGKLKGKTQDAYPSQRSPTCKRIKAINRVYIELFDPAPKRKKRVVQALLDEGFREKKSVQETFCVGVSLPILDLLYQCRCDPTLSEDMVQWSPESWSLVDRIDLSRNAAGRPTDLPTISVPDRPEQPVDDTTEQVQETEDSDGLRQLEIDSSLLFRNDNRIREVAHLLRSSTPVLLQVPRPVEVSDHDYEKQKQTKLLSLARRTLSLSVGRGMLTIGSLRPVPAEPLPLAELCLKGRLPPTNATIALDTSECPADLTVWPEFHGGVAAGLRLPRRKDQSSIITRTWILYNRPPPAPSSEESAAEATIHEAKTHCHGGVLLALGLRGHLTCLEMSDVYDYLTKGTVTTTVGMMLGLATNKRGTCDMSVSKMLCLHIPSLIPQHFSAIDVASSVQASAVIGNGLLFQRSSHRMMTEFLLNEIGRRPDSDVTVFDREAYTLSCGIALGMVNLCLGGEAEDVARAAGIADLRVEDRLFKYVSGGVDEDEARRTRESNDRFSMPYAQNTGDTEKCCVTYEGEMINTDVTAPGATIALGLMYMKSGNLTIATALGIPNTHFLLEFVRPDFLTLRTFSRALVLWDNVEPTQAWIEAQVPSVVATAYEEIKSTARMMAMGTCLSPKSRRSAPDYDRRAVRQIYVHVVAGACFGMGLRYAGTGHPGAKAAITASVLELAKLREAKDTAALAIRPELPILETCLGLASIALALVLAGTGDLESLRLFRVLQWRCDDTVTYGNHMVFGMAIGLLFLGGGRCTIGREPEDIAALVAAFFPRFPTDTSDNHAHLQALRHLYTLAVRERQVVAVDVDSGHSVHVTAHVQGQTFETPFLLRNSDVPPQFLDFRSDAYFPLRVALDPLADRPTVFFVKKRHRPLLMSSSLGAAATDEEKEAASPEAMMLRRFGEYSFGGGAAAATRQLGHSKDPAWDYLCQQLVERGLASSLSTYLALATSCPDNSALDRQLHEWNLHLVWSYWKMMCESNRNCHDPRSSCSNQNNGVSLLHGDLLALILERYARAQPDAA